MPKFEIYLQYPTSTMVRPLVMIILNRGFYANALQLELSFLCGLKVGKLNRRACVASKKTLEKST